MPEQELNCAEVSARLEEMDRERRAQRMRRDRLGNARPSARLVACALDRTAADRGARPRPGEEPVRGPVDLPLRAQDL